MRTREENKHSPGIRGRLRRPAALVLSVVLVAALSGCSGFSRYTPRREHLQETMKRFHLALFVQDTRSLVRSLPLEDRPLWAEAFSCFFDRYRVVDYEIQQIKTGSRVEEARAVVWMSIHPIKSMTVRETVWVQEWILEDKRWVLFPDSESTQAFLGDCYRPLEAGKDVTSP